MCEAASLRWEHTRSEFVATVIIATSKRGESAKADTMDIRVLLVALAIDPFIGWLDKDSWLLLFEEWPFWLFGIFFGIVGALIAVLLFPTLAGANVIAAIVMAAIGAAIAVILFAIGWCLYFLYLFLRYWDDGGGL